MTFVVCELFSDAISHIWAKIQRGIFLRDRSARITAAYLRVLVFVPFSLSLGCHLYAIILVLCDTVKLKQRRLDKIQWHAIYGRYPLVELARTRVVTTCQHHGLQHSDNNNLYAMMCPECDFPAPTPRVMG